MDDEMASPSASSQGARPRTRRYLPRVSLRSLLILGVVCSLLFGWVGRNLYRVRQEQAAVEALKQGGAKFSRIDAAGYHRDDSQALEGYDAMKSLFGWTKRPVLAHVTIRTLDSDDAKALAAVAAMVQFPEIESVGLQGAVFDETSLATLAKLPRLDSVQLLDGVQLSGAGIAKLGPPLRVRGLMLGYGEVSEEAIESAVALPDLKALVLVEVDPATGDLFAPLQRAPRLKTLALVGDWVRDQDMTTVAQLEGLEELTVYGIGDDGLARLAPLSKLKTIRLSDPVTKAAAQAFAAAHPRCRVEWLDAQGRTHSIQAPAVGRTDAASQNPWDSPRREPK